MQTTSSQTNSIVQNKIQTSNQFLHSIVLILIGTLALIALSYPLACWRVSQQEKFGGLHLKTKNMDRD